jgi:ankyrin repeat protein
MLASHMGLLDVMRALLLRDREKPNKDRKGPLHVTDSEGWTVLHWAVWNGTGSHIDNAVLKLLLQYHDNHDSDGMRYSNSDENEIGDDNKDSTPHMKHQDARKKAQVLNIQDKKGLTALHWAAADDQEGAMRLLLDAGAAVDIFDAEGMTPLSLAVENKFLGPVELLIEYGADINATI